LSGKCVPKLTQLAMDPQDGDDWVAAGLLFLVRGESAQAEQALDKAKSLGTDVNRYLGTLAQAALARAEKLVHAADPKKPDYGKADFQKAFDAVAAVETKYAAIAWFASNKKAFDAVRARARAGIRDAEAEALYAEAMESYTEKELFDVRERVQQLRSDYAGTRPLTDSTRKPPFTELEQAVANLGKQLTVRLDGKGDFKTIQEAIKAAPANSRIEIQDNGPYNEKVRIDKEGLRIRGKKGCWPIITSTGPVTNFPILVHVSAPKVCIERLVLLHGSAAGDSAACISGSVSIRACLGWGTAGWYLGTGTMEDCLTLCRVEAVRHVKNCLCFGGIDNFWGAGGRLENVYVKSGGHPAYPFDNVELRSCTIDQPVLVSGPNVRLLDCIFAFVQSDRLDAVIEHCNAYRTPPFVGEVKPGKGCFGGKPMFVDPKNFDYRLMPNSPCRGRASDGGDVGCRYTPQMIEMLMLAFELRKRGIIKF
jgi:hypothetical protein